MITPYVEKYIKKFITLVFPKRETVACVETCSVTDLVLSTNPIPACECVALLPYKDKTVQALLWEVKYHQNKDAAEMLGAVLASYICTLSQPEMVVVPIPLAPARLRERGHNQVLTILRYVPHITISDDLLIRVRNTPHQTTLPRQKRLVNMKGAFRVNDHILNQIQKTEPGNTISKDIPILLIDDVVTTGTTLGEAKRTLEKAGFTNVSCLAIAH